MTIVATWNVNGKLIEEATTESVGEFNRDIANKIVEKMIVSANMESKENITIEEEQLTIKDKFKFGGHAEIAKKNGNFRR